MEQVGIKLGAEVHGVDLSQPLDDATVAVLKKALDTRKVVYARGQDLTPAQHVALGRRFGDLEVHPFSPHGDLPEVFLLDTRRPQPTFASLGQRPCVADHRLPVVDGSPCPAARPCRRLCAPVRRVGPDQFLLLLPCHVLFPFVRVTTVQTRVTHDGGRHT